MVQVGGKLTRVGGKSNFIMYAQMSEKLFNAHVSIQPTR